MVVLHCGRAAGYGESAAFSGSGESKQDRDADGAYETDSPAAMSGDKDVVAGPALVVRVRVREAVRPIWLDAVVQECNSGVAESSNTYSSKS